MVAELCSWHTVPRTNTISYQLWYKDILSIASVFKMPDESEWLAGKWVAESYVNINDSDDLDAMIECAERDAEYIITNDRSWLDNYTKEIE